MKKINRRQKVHLSFSNVRNLKDFYLQRTCNVNKNTEINGKPTKSSSFGINYAEGVINCPFAAKKCRFSDLQCCLIVSTTYNL